jgi:hypothetical protein
MAYLPPNPTEATSFPVAYGVDIATAIRMAEEKWQRHFPSLAYYPLKKAVTPAEPNEDSPVGEAGNTVFDPIWGEAIPASMATEWEQPHADDVPNAPHPEIHADPVQLHLRIQREATEKELKRYGFDELRDLLAFSPLSLLDEAGIEVTQGDYFIWDGDEYEVLQMERSGYWKNTNVRLYLVMNCTHRRAGS